MSVYSLGSVSPVVSSTSWISPTSVVLGDIELRDNVSVWFGAVLRGDNERITIGEGSNIQDNVVCHTDPGFPLVVGIDCTIGHQALLHGCVIGSGTLIGMGSMIMNGAVIGEGCLVGAGSLITESKQIPDNSLVMGSPAKVIRELDETTRNNLRLAAEVYRTKAVRYGEGLCEIALPDSP